MGKYSFIFAHWESVKEDLVRGFYGKYNITIDEVINLTVRNAREFQALFYEVATKKKAAKTLESLFLPYYQNAYVQELNKEKAKLGEFPNWLRIYAIRVNPDYYVITGGAIKLTRTTQERDHTLEEHNRLIREEIS